MPINLKTAIRSFRSQDCSGLFKISTKNIFTWLPYGPFETEEAMRSFYEELSTKCELYSVFNSDYTTIHGIFALKNISNEHKKCEIGHIWYGEQYQRTHVNTEAMFLALSECFEERGFRRVSWKCDNLNLNSKRCVSRLGFRYEGLFSNDQIVKGQNKDTAWFAITDNEWPNVKQNFISRFFSTAYCDARRPLSLNKNGHAPAPDTNIREKNRTTDVSPVSSADTVAQQQRTITEQQQEITRLRALVTQIHDQLQQGQARNLEMFGVFPRSTTPTDSNSPQDQHHDQSSQTKTPTT